MVKYSCVVLLILFHSRSYSDLIRLQEQAKRKAAEDGDDDDERYQDPDNETGLFNTAPYEADDEEADKIYEAIDAKLDERRKARR